MVFTGRTAAGWNAPIIWMWRKWHGEPPTISCTFSQPCLEVSESLAGIQLAGPTPPKSKLCEQNLGHRWHPRLWLLSIQADPTVETFQISRIFETKEIFQDRVLPPGQAGAFSCACCHTARKDLSLEMPPLLPGTYAGKPSFPKQNSSCSAADHSTCTKTLNATKYSVSGLRKVFLPVYGQ